MSDYQLSVKIRDCAKPNYVIMRDTPNGQIIVSGTFTILENAKKELRRRLNFKVPEGLNVPETVKGWSAPYLVEITVNIKKIEIEEKEE